MLKLLVIFSNLLYLCKSIYIPINQLGNNGEYFISSKIELGSDKQSFLIELDTGSTPLWVPSKSCQLNGNSICYGNTFDQTTSTTLKKNIVNEVFSIAYDDGTTFDGEYIEDTLFFGGNNYTNFIFGLVETASYPVADEQFNIGILGLAPPYNDGSEPASSILDFLYNRSMTLFSLYLPRNIQEFGKFGLGEYDTNNIINWVPVVLTDESWYLPNMNIEFNGNSITAKYTTIIDTGSDFLYLPKNEMKKLCPTIGANYNKKLNECSISCNSVQNLKNFVLNFGGIKLDVNITNFYYRDKTNTDICVVPLFGDKPKYGWTIGVAMIRQWYTIWDFSDYKNQKGKVGFANL